MVSFWLTVVSLWLIYLALRAAWKIKKEPGETAMRVLSILGNVIAAALLNLDTISRHTGLNLNDPGIGIAVLSAACFAAAELAFLLWRLVSKLPVEWRQNNGAQPALIANSRRLGSGTVRVRWP